MDDPDVQDSFVDLAGGQLFVRTWTPANSSYSAPLILLHDSLGCVELWRDFPALLAQSLSRPVIAYDRLGFGKSSVNMKLPTATFIEDEAAISFPAVRDALGIRKYALFGHSVGGSMALTIAATDSSSCERVVTEAAQAFVEDRTTAGIQSAWEQLKQPEHFHRLAKWHGKKADWVLRAWTGIWLSPEFADWTLEPALQNVRCPVLAIHGDQDEFGSAAFPAMISDLSKGPATFSLLDECGHVPHRQRQTDVLKHIETFFN